LPRTATLQRYRTAPVAVSLCPAECPDPAGQGVNSSSIETAIMARREMARAID